MARAHEVAIGADGRDFNRAIKDDIIKPVEEAARSLDDLGDDGAKDLGKLETALKDVQRQSDKAGRDIGNDLDKGFDKASKSVDGFGKNARDELKDSAREGAASFRGELTDVGDVVQEAAANLGPAGIIGGAVVGSILAVATESVTKWNEKIQGIKDATATMWQEAAAEGKAYLDEDAITAEAHRILWDEAYKSDLEAAEKAGVSRSDLAIALATGEGEAFDRVHQAFMTAREQEAQKTQDNYDKYGAASEGAIRLESAEGVQIGKTISVLDEKAKSVDTNKEKAAAASEVTKTLHKDEREQIEKTKQADQRRYEALAEHYGKPIEGSVNLKINADTTSLDAAKRAAEAWARNGLKVAVTGTLSGRTWE